MPETGFNRNFVWLNINALLPFQICSRKRLDLFVLIEITINDPQGYFNIATSIVQFKNTMITLQLRFNKPLHNLPTVFFFRLWLARASSETSRGKGRGEGSLFRGLISLATSASQADKSQSYGGFDVLRETMFIREVAALVHCVHSSETVLLCVAYSCGRYK